MCAPCRRSGRRPHGGERSRASGIRRGAGPPPFRSARPAGRSRAPLRRHRRRGPCTVAVARGAPLPRSPGGGSGRGAGPGLRATVRRASRHPTPRTPLPAPHHPAPRGARLGHPARPRRSARHGRAVRAADRSDDAGTRGGPRQAVGGGNLDVRARRVRGRGRPQTGRRSACPTARPAADARGVALRGGRPAGEARAGGEVARVAHLVLMQRLPAVAVADLTAFGAALTEVQRITGGWFAPAQGGVFAPGETGELIERLRRWGAIGVGQSSWGPAVYGIVADAGAAAALAGRVRTILRPGGAVYEGGFSQAGGRVWRGVSPVPP